MFPYVLSLLIDLLCQVNLSRGLKALADPYVPTIGTYLPLEQRKLLQVEGLMAPGVGPRYVELQRIETTWLRLTGDLDRYELLSSLYNADRNLWMLLCKSNPAKYTKIFYTPGVANGKNIGYIYHFLILFVRTS